MRLSKTKSLPSIRQQGLALIMSLVILLVLTLLGVTAMNTSNLQLLMTGNSQYQTTALNIAEGVIRIAEDEVAGLVGVTGATWPTSGYYDISGSGSLKDIFSNVDWDDSTQVATEGSSQYIIEYTGVQTLDSASAQWRQDNGIIGDDVSVFRITARTPSTRGAVRYVQSIFVTLKAPI